MAKTLYLSNMYYFIYYYQLEYSTVFFGNIAFMFVIINWYSKMVDNARIDWLNS